MARILSGGGRGLPRAFRESHPEATASLGARGYTLVETAIVLALAGFIIQAGAFSWRKLEPKFRLRSAVWKVHTVLNQARFRAIWTGTAVRVRFVPGGYRVETRDEETAVWRLHASGLFEGAEVQANNTPAFHPEGTVSSLASILVSNPSGAYKITIAITGRVKVVQTG